MTKLKSPPLVPIWQTLFSLKKFAENPIPFMTNGLLKYGDIYKVFGPRPFILTNNADYIQHVLQKNNKNYHKSPVVKNILGAELGHGLLTIDGDYWLKQRRLIQPGFSKQRISELIDIMISEGEAFCRQMKEELEKHPVLDVDKSMMDITFRIVTKALFSRGIDHSLLQRVDYVITNIQKYVITQIRQPYLIPWLKITGKANFYKSLRKEIDQIVYDIIDERRKSEEQHNDLLDMLLNAKYEDTGETMNNQQLRDESMILIVAGHETSANALTWALYLLAQHPEERQKVLDEVNLVIGNQPITYDSVLQLNYTRQVIQETMRLYPPAWLIDRQALEDDELGGYLVPKGEIVLLFIYGTHRNPKYWKNPDTFDPDRFSKENLKDLPNYAYFPFGGGPRLCIGNNFSMLEMQVLLALLVKNFTFTIEPNQHIEPKPMVTLRPRNGIKMKFQIR